MPDVYPGNLLGELRALQKRVEDLEAQLNNRPGMSEASAGWILRAMATPDTSSLDAADGHIYFKGGRLCARNGGNGSEIQLLPIPQAADSGEVTSADADGTYSAGEQALLNELKADHNLMRFNLRQVGLMA